MSASPAPVVSTTVRRHARRRRRRTSPRSIAPSAPERDDDRCAPPASKRLGRALGVAPPGQQRRLGAVALQQERAGHAAARERRGRASGRRQRSRRRFGSKHDRLAVLERLAARASCVSSRSCSSSSVFELKNSASQASPPPRRGAARRSRGDRCRRRSGRSARRRRRPSQTRAASARPSTQREPVERRRPRRASRSRSQRPQASSPAPPASATSRAVARGDHGGVGDVAAEVREKASASASRSTGRSQIRSTSASPRQRVRTGRQRYLARAPWPRSAEHTGLLGEPARVLAQRAGRTARALPPRRPDRRRRSGRRSSSETGGIAATCRASAARASAATSTTRSRLRAFARDFAELRGLDRVRLVVHDWGAAGLLFAMRAPARIERLVIIDAVPLLPGFRWHRVARVWRRRGAGEMVMGARRRGSIGCARPISARAGRRPSPRLRPGHAARDAAASTAGAPEDELARAGADLGTISAPGARGLGRGRPVHPGALRPGLRRRARPNATARRPPRRGHWPWLGDPGVIDRVSGFLSG